MKIGVLTYRQVPYISANTSIGYAIAKELQKEHEVCLIGFRQNRTQNDVVRYASMPVRFLNRRIYRENSRISSVIRKVFGEKAAHIRLSLGLRRIVKQEHIDALLTVTAPSSDIWIAVGSHLKLPMVWLQLDPFYSVGDLVSKVEKQNFMCLMQGGKIQHLFTTDLLYAEYVADPDMRCFLPKISVAQFPKVDICNYSVDRARNPKPILLYAGSLYRQIRNPQILIQLKNMLGNACDVWFCGGCDNPEDEAAISASSIRCFGYLSQEKLTEITASADILINIGNSVHNQLGSKLLDYISTGKPILNITQIDNCPTERVLEQYPLKYTVKAAQIPEYISEIARFCRDTQDMRVSKEQILENYREYTPEYVGGKLYEIISKIVDEGKENAQDD